MDLKILTYNVHGLPWCRVPILPILTWAVRRTDADVICLQEVFQRKALTDIVSYAPLYGYRVLVPPECVTPSCFANPSGLCTLVKASIPITQVVFTPFVANGGLEHAVRKGVLRAECWKDGVRTDIFNTHFQSDITEIPCVRIRHQQTRDLQEDQLEVLASRSECPIVTGDFNQCMFRAFERVDPTFHITFPETWEHLDHCLLYGPSRTKVVAWKTVYYDEVNASDHVPVLTWLRIRKELNPIPEERSNF